jgi:hypothetical protein
LEVICRSGVKEEISRPGQPDAYCDVFVPIEIANVRSSSNGASINQPRQETIEPARVVAGFEAHTHSCKWV